MKRLFSLLLTLTLLPSTLMAANTSLEEACGEGGCDTHSGMYHFIDIELLRYANREKVDAYYDFVEQQGGAGSEEHNIVNFLLFTGITKEEFIAIEGQFRWFNNESPEFGGPGYYPDIIYSGDPELIEAFYSYPASPDTGR
ncbi:MAG: hypothetical protein KH009_07770 [Clostridiales bacterium]|nr:hypothetical protein [Clostridiales bacterium]